MNTGLFFSEINVDSKRNRRRHYRNHYDNTYNNSRINGQPTYVLTAGEFNDYIIGSDGIAHAQGSHDVSISTPTFYANSAADRAEWHDVDDCRKLAYETMRVAKNENPEHITHVRYFKVSSKVWAIDACLVNGVMVSNHGYTSYCPKHLR